MHRLLYFLTWKKFYSFVTEDPIKKSLAEIPEKIQRTLRIDTRFVVFDCVVNTDGPKPVFHFTVSSDYAAQGIEAQFAGKAAARLYNYTITRVPKKDEFAIAHVSVAQVMAAPSFRCEQLTQMLLGESGDVLQRSGPDWVRVRLHADGYIGWVSSNQITEVPLGDMIDWIESAKVTPKKFVVPMRAGREKTTEPVGEFLFGTYLPILKIEKSWMQLMLPDGVTGWVESSMLQKPVRVPADVSSERIIDTAKMFLGISYVWGGRSVKGFDCSGFTQTVYRLNGIELPRDASLQWKAGEDAGDEYKKFVEGDLLFFGPSKQRITHVAISLGEDAYIHESGTVHCSSLNAKSPLYSKKYAKTFQGARRLGAADSD
jgi:gamma-D-glutamyl-L-lysine dipeptidyl-peptidase